MLLVAASLLGTQPTSAREQGETTDGGESGFLDALPVALQAPPARRIRVEPDIPPSLRQTLDTLVTTPPSPDQIWAARQWMSQMEPKLARFVRDEALRGEMLTRIYHEARLAGLAPEIVLAVIQVESAFRADAVSSAGAVGLMQIMPFWIGELGRSADDLMDPWLNLRYGCTILAHYLAVERGDLTRALARYNGSLGQTWYPERVMRAWTDHWWVGR
ncbi:lytic transglycosylase domain-containing protein [Halomonas sp. LR3S48]|uniref:lytic transglycosylase domain-containing protein n=1 Tax=Halomonadaceae TaxID=28256 RepID=UPI00398EF687